VNNFRVNVLQGKSARYGVAPAWGYLVAQLRVLGWAAIPLYAAAVLGARRVPRAGSAALAILFVHSCLGHKEYRFIFPASAIVIALAAVGVSELASRSRPLAVGALLLLGSAGVVRGIDFHTEQTTLGLWLYPASGQWSNDRGPLLAFELFSHDPRVCGVGLLGVPWYVTGGYTWLHRAIPIVELRTADEQDPNPSSVNALVGPEHLPARFGSFERRACWTGVCAYARAGGCTPTAGYSLNDVIMARGE
jgi:hypothetical protein